MGVVTKEEEEGGKEEEEEDRSDDGDMRDDNNDADAAPLPTHSMEDEVEEEEKEERVGVNLCGDAEVVGFCAASATERSASRTSKSSIERLEESGAVEDASAV